MLKAPNNSQKKTKVRKGFSINGCFTSKLISLGMDEQRNARASNNFLITRNSIKTFVRKADRKLIRATTFR
jgi:hypothetical protein